MLEAVKLAKMYGNRLVFKEVSFLLEPATIHVLQGANGSGKSTLVKILAGLVNKDAGKIDTELKIDDIGYVGHGTFLYSQMTAMENLRFWFEVHKNKKIQDKEIQDLLEHVGLGAFIHEKTGIFSRGMAQRVNLVRVLLQKPKLFLLDEPSTGLDIASKTLLDEEIKQAKANGAAVLWVSHDKERDEKIADYIHLIENKQFSTVKVERHV